MGTDIFEKIDVHLQNHRMGIWTGTFRDYLGMVMKQPSLVQRAHARLYNMIRRTSVQVDDEGKEHYAFFEQDLFGIDEPLARVVEYFKAAAMGSDVGRRVLLLYGPPSSGKSQLVILLKRGLEVYTQTDEGAIYAIADCPQHEDPLNLMPHPLRKDFQAETGIHIEGELCPLCAVNLREQYQGDIYRVPVKRTFFSEKERMGIGTFVPSDPKSQDISELVGSIDLSTVGDYGSESDPRAYRFDGELNVANRGLMEFIEMLKADERFLYVLLTLSQEKNIKTGRFPLIYADECVISHTNETEFNEFLGDKKSEALHDRMIMVRIPYNLKVSQEERIYQKLLRATSLEGVHIAPHTLRVAAVFAVLSRLEEPKMSGLTLLKKLKLYDGEDVEGFRQKDVKQIKEQTMAQGSVYRRSSSELPWELRRRGLKDSLRHDQRVKEAIRKNLRELIAEEAIITSDGTKRVKIPLRYLDQYRFKYGQPPQGVGQGEGQPGDVLGQRGSNGNGPGDGQPGDQPGEHTYEVEVPLAELAQMMLEDLALPWLEEKPERQITTTSHRFTDIRRTGSLANLDKRRTLLENIKRNAARGVPAVGHFHDADLRYKVWDTYEQHQANAAVYMLMDVSGSMTTSKKYIAKSFFFWMVRFLQLKYQKVDMVFIAHDTEAQVVPEQDFFAMSQGGGTCCSSAYQLALAHLQQHHPGDRWNTYLFHFSDGDNLPDDNTVCKGLVDTLLKHCSMVGYGEIRYRDDASFYGWIGQTSSAPSSLQYALQGITHPRLLSVTITHKEELFQVLQTFLQPRETAHV